MKKVYLIKNLEEGYYKIGIAKDPQKRLSQLQTGNSAKLRILYTYPSEYAKKIENSLHNRYQYLRKEGEWFDFSIKEEVNFIENCKKIEGTIIFLVESGNDFI